MAMRPILPGTDPFGSMRISKRCHGLRRCRYRGEAGMQRWVGLGVIANNLTAIARARTG